MLPPWQEYVTPPARLFQGGPVALDSALGIVTVPGDDARAARRPQALRRPRAWWTSTSRRRWSSAEIAGMRIFAGYAGWSAGQLEGEIEAGGWYVVDAEARDAFTPEPDGLWRSVLRRQRGNLALVATFPDDPTMN